MRPSSTMPRHAVRAACRQKALIPTGFWYFPTMEPASAPTNDVATQRAEPAAGAKTRKGKAGSLDNPEIREDVPGHIIPILEREFDDFDNEAAKYLAGITPEQMEAFADVVEKYAPLNKGHVTTRQNIQLHHVPLPDAAKAIRELSDSGLSSREGCGNTMRNVTGDPWAGVCEGELFDPTPYAGAYVSADDGEYLKVTEAVMRIFDRQDWLRKNRARARIKVFVDKYGIEELARQVDEELKGDWVAERDFDPQPLLFVDDEEAGAPAAPTAYASPNGDGSDYERWRATSVVPQRQAGFSTVQIKVIRGDVTPEQFRGLAEIMRRYCGGYARTTVEQNLLLRWVRDESVYEVWSALEDL